MKSITSTLITLMMVIGMSIPMAFASADKTTICHQTGSGEVTITVANASLLPAHFEHGDTEGACAPSNDSCIYPAGDVCVCDKACVDNSANNASETGKAHQNDKAKSDKVVAASCTCIDGSSGGLYNSDGAGTLTPMSGMNPKGGQSFREVPGQ